MTHDFAGQDPQGIKFWAAQRLQASEAGAI